MNFDECYHYDNIVTYMKYNINPSLNKFKRFSPPYNKLIFPISSLVLSIAPKGFDKKKVIIEKFKIDGVKGFCITPINLITTKSRGLFYLHGGGFAYKANPSQFKKMEEYAYKANMRVIFVDYGLTPKHIYPYAINEGIRVYKRFIESSIGKYLDLKNIFFGGDSAGASIATDMYLTLSLENYPILPKGLMLIYPVVSNDVKTKSKELYNNTPMWNSKKNNKMWKYYLKDNKYVSPLERIHLFKPNLEVYIETCEYDCLRDEGILLYGALKDKVGYTSLNDTSGTYHGYDMVSKSHITISSVNKRIEFLLRRNINSKQTIKTRYGSDRNLVKKNISSNNVCDNHIDGA